MTISEAAQEASKRGSSITRIAWGDIGVYGHVLVSNLDQRMILIKANNEIITGWSPQLDDICANDWFVLCQTCNGPYI